MPLPLFSPDAIAPYAHHVAQAQQEQAVAPPKSSGSWWLPAAATVAGNSADVLSTLAALKRPGVKEGNPIFGGSNPASIVGLKAAATIPEVLAERALARSGHPTAAKVVGLMIGALGGGAALHNSHVGQP